MPRKTKKQKLKSQQRKQFQPTSNQVVKRDFEFSLKSFPQSSSQQIDTKKQYISSQIDEIKLVRRDIIKTLILAVIIFSLELVLYFAWLKNS